MYKSLYKETESYVRTRNENSKKFKFTLGLKQGCILSPILFNLVLDEVIQHCKKDLKGYKVGYWKIKVVEIVELCYADDMVIIAKTERELQHNMERLSKELKIVNLPNTNLLFPTSWCIIILDIAIFERLKSVCFNKLIA